MVFLEALDLPAMTPAVLALFAARGVVTVEDFLIHKVHELSVAAEQTSESDELKEAIAEVLSYLDSLQSGWCNGFDFSQKETRILSMGLSSFDDLLLQGSLQEGTITELVGSSSTGKTQICMQAAASIAYRLHCSVIYVDTCNAFSSQRVAHMLGGHLGSLLKVEEQRSELAHAMKNIQRIGLFEIYSVLAFLQDLNVYLQSTSEISQLRLLIVDSVSSVISPILGGNNVQGIPLTGLDYSCRFSLYVPHMALRYYQSERHDHRQEDVNLAISRCALDLLKGWNQKSPHPSSLQLIDAFQ